MLEKKSPAQKPSAEGDAKNRLRQRILQAVEGLQFGQVVIVIQEGKVTQIERTEKKRYPSMQGLDGEGI